MVNENHHRQVEDPIANYSGLSLFRSAFSLSSSKPYDDLDAIDEVLRSMDLGNSAKLVEQGKSVLECNLGFNTENSTKDVGDDDVFAAEEDEEFRRKNRGPGLGLNRVRPLFSLKETKKPSVEDLLPVLDFKNIKDPNELFMAHERLENARKEIQKQLGIVPSESTMGSTKPRERRPGLPGFNRRPIKFRPSFSQETLDNNADALSSQEAFESDNLDPVGDNTEKGKASFVSLDNEVTGSSAVKEKKVNDILKGLLTLDSEELEGFGAMSRLQKRLQIKPVVFQKSSVPDFPDSQPMDLKSSYGNLSKPTKASSDISSLLRGIDIKTPIRQDVGYPEKQLASPTPPRSPSVLFSTLQKHISQSKPSKPSVDPFSAHEIDHESTKENSPTHMLNQEVNIVGSSKPSDELGAPIIEGAIAADETNKILDISARPKEHNSRKLSEQLKASLTENEVAVSETCSVGGPTRTCISTPKKSTVDNSREPGFNAKVDSNEPPVDMDLDIGGSDVGKRVMDDTEGRQNVEPNEPDQFEDEMLAENMQETSDSIPTDDSNFNLVNPLADKSSPDVHEDIVDQSNPDAREDIADQSNPDAHEDIVDQSNPDSHEDIADHSNPDAHEDNSADNRSRRSDDGPEQCSQKKTVGSVAPVGGQKRVKTRAQKTPKGKRLRLAIGHEDNSADNRSRKSDEGPEQCLQKKTVGSVAPVSGQKRVKTRAQKAPKGKRLRLAIGHEDNSADNRSRKSDDGPEQCLQRKTVGSVAPVSGQKRVETCAQKAPMGKRLRPRMSLADAGTSWDSGVRRSSRFKTRPLEFWKGERMVYGRVHESLTTVIGVKCLSPGADGKPIMKAKSFVSEKHKKLFELASRY
ncbi:centromere protein C-like isoform X1 [Vicia villosa]|uniref:centromere protein C-like isoform X1 n=1 Tax=Vicia villosa TaxID=3911 RepID=UPI00273CCD95|nr:centromere protein C-like isoform X1 [Vicia villosa]